MSDITDAVFQDQVADSLLGAPLPSEPSQQQDPEYVTAEDLHVDRESGWQADDENQAEGQPEELEPLEATEYAHDEAFEEALENYSQLEPDEQSEVVSEIAGRGYEQAAEMVDPKQAQLLSSEFFDLFGRQELAEHINAPAFAGFLAFWGQHLAETVGKLGTSNLTYEQAAQASDPQMSAKFTHDFFAALNAEDVADQMDPQVFASYWGAWGPRLMSGRQMSPELAQQFTQDFYTLFGEPDRAQTIDAGRFAQYWSAWGARLGNAINGQQRRQAASPARVTKQRDGTPWRSNRDLFDTETITAMHGRL